MCKNCYIFGAGECCRFPEIPADALVIAADGGYRKLASHGIKPDLLLGDFDSLLFIPENIETIRFKSEKDDTDMSLAIDEGISRGYDTFHLYGGTGGRLDHTLANIQCIARLSQKGLRGFLHDTNYVITAISNNKVEFDESHTGYVSAFSHSDASTGVYESGLKYSLDNATLSNLTPLGVSNEFCGKKSTISVENGTLIIVYNA